MGDQEQQRQSGSVKWFNATKGYGFITPAGGGADLFVHQTSINAEGFRSLRESELVEFEVEQGPDGREKAVKVTGPAGVAPQGAPRQPRYRGAAAAAAATAAAAGGAVPAATFPARGRGAGRGAYGRGAGFYPGYEYGGYYDYGYAPRGRGRAMRGGRGPPLAARGRGRFPPAAAGAAAAAGAQEPPAEPSGLQVVVHNLPWSCTWQQLKDTFKEWKVERADVIYDSYTGRSRGFGVVRFSSKEDAQAACDKLNNTEIDGRTVSVRIDRFA